MHPTVPLRPLGTAEILDGAVRLVRRNGRAVLTVRRSRPQLTVRYRAVRRITSA